MINPELQHSTSLLDRPERAAADVSNVLEVEPNPDVYLDNRNWEATRQELERSSLPLQIIVEEGVLDEGDVLHSTVVGAGRSGKTTLMEQTGQKLELPIIDAGIVFRALAARYMVHGGTETGVDSQIIARVIREVAEAQLVPGRPSENIDQSIIIGDAQLTYGQLDGIPRSVMARLSQEPELHRVAKSLLINQVSNRFILVGGRALNQDFDQALARFYIHREGPTVAEGGKTWHMDSPNDPRIINVLNPEGHSELASELMSVVIARRSEARVSGNEKHSLLGGRLSLVTSEAAKVAEVEEILRNPGKSIEGVDKGELLVPKLLVDEMRIALQAKAESARRKFPGTPLIVESTALYVPELDAQGIPLEVVEFLSKRHPEKLSALLKGDTSAVAFTVAELINSNDSQLVFGATRGSLIQQSRGRGGFGWDGMFKPEDQERTFAEMGVDKSKYSSRALAIRQLNVN